MPWATNDRVRIYWEEEGSGEPLLMVTGLSLSMAMWGELRPYLARRFRTILFDNRCAGQSDVPRRLFSISEMARDALCVMDSAGVNSAHVVGISMGGMIAQELALRHPERITRLVLGCTHAGGFRSVRARPQVLRLLAAPLMAPDDKLAAMVPYIYHAKTPAERIAADLQLMRRNVPSLRGYLQQLTAIISWSSWSRLPSMKVPVLIIHGDADLLVPTENARILASRIPNSRLIILPNAGHMFATDQPELTRAALLGFLQPSASAA
jgi:pimeloyl-ACP methyl ester carboxylesterase